MNMKTAVKFTIDVVVYTILVVVGYSLGYAHNSNAAYDAGWNAAAVQYIGECADLLEELEKVLQ